MKRLLSCAAFALTLALTASAVAQPQQADAVGSVQSLIGRADVIRAGQAQDAIALVSGDPIFARDVIRTKRDAALIITMQDGSRLTLGENNRLEIAEYVTQGEPSALLKLVRGRLRNVVTKTFSQRRGAYRVQTSNAIMGVQGTEFTVDAQPLLTRILVYENQVSVESIGGGQRLLEDNDYTVVRREQNPSAEVIAPLSVGSGSQQFLRSGAPQALDPFGIIR